MENTHTLPDLIDLHLHLDGSLPPLTARKLAQMQGIAIPDTQEELIRKMSIKPDCKDLNDYLSRFSLPCSLLHTKEALAIGMQDLLAELHRQGLVYAEVRFAPQKSAAEGLSQYEAAESALAAMQNAPIPCGLILSMMRDGSHEVNLETVEVAKALHSKGVVAVDLAGAESLYPTHLFREEFAAVRAAGLPLIIHAGEAEGAESVREAIQADARRIGHGVRSLEDPEVVQMLVSEQITLELCPTSNLNTGLFPDYAHYPLRELMNAGVRVCINTDNMTVSSTTLADEWHHLIDALHLTQDEIRQIEKDSQQATFR